MAEIKKPDAILSKLLEKFDGQDVLPDVRIYSEYTGNFLDPAMNFGAFGFLPVAGTSTGDVLGMTPIIGKPLGQWPVIKFGHSGWKCEVVSSSLQLLPASAMATDIRPKYILDDRNGILENRVPVLEMAAMFGDKSQAGNFITFLEKLDEERDDEQSTLSLYRLSEGKGWVLDFLETYQQVYVNDSDPLKGWESYLINYPFVIPAWELLCSAQIKMEKDASLAAWRAVSSELHFSNSLFDACRMYGMTAGFDASDSDNFDYLFEDQPRTEICRYLADSGMGRDNPLFKAVIKEAEEEECGDEWLKAAKTLQKAGKNEEAYPAFINAGYHMYNDDGGFSVDAARGALRSAEAMNNPDMVFLHKTLLEQMKDGE